MSSAFGRRRFLAGASLIGVPLLGSSTEAQSRRVEETAGRAPFG